MYCKTTDRKTTLKADSFHPNWLKNNIPFGQFQRLRRICDTENEYEMQAKVMSNRQRGYHTETIHNAYEITATLEKEKTILQTKPGLFCYKIYLSG